MRKKFAVIIILAFVFISVSPVVYILQMGRASVTIYIRPGGEIDPPDANITRIGDIYEFTDDNQGSLVIQRDNIVINGLNFKLQGSGGDGVSLSGRTNVTIMNIEIIGFERGIHLYNSLFNSISGNHIRDNEDSGIYLESCSNNTITSNYIVNNGGYSYGGRSSIHLSYSPNNTVTQNNITGNTYLNGIGLWSSSNNTVYENRIANNFFGIRIDQNSNHNRISENNITSSNSYGIHLIRSINNTLYDNLLDNNRYGFNVYGEELSHYLQNIETSNLVNRRPAYYLINHHNLNIRPSTHPQIGFLALINSTNINVEGHKLIENGLGLLIAYTNNSRIAGNNITGNYDGLKQFNSFNNSILKNNIIANEYRGIYLWDSNGNRILENRIIDNIDLGIYLSDSSNNTLYGNTIANSDYAIELNGLNNSINRNNFVNNTQQIDSYDLINFWDNGFEGNYWSNYNGSDANNDGIGDVPYEIDSNNNDTYPLMGLFSSFNTSLGKQVTVVSNSTIEDLEYFAFNNTIRMHVSESAINQTFGFCRVCIPKDLIAPNYTVTINGAEPFYVNYTINDNNTHRWIYFAYQHSTLEIVIIPEFPTWTAMLLILIGLTVAVAIYKQRLLKAHA